MSALSQAAALGERKAGLPGALFTSNHDKVELAGYETDRRLFLGRGPDRKAACSFTIRNELPRLSRTTGATLDPICALQAEVALVPYETVQLAFVTITANSRKEALRLVYRYRRWSQIGRALATLYRGSQRAHPAECDDRGMSNGSRNFFLHSFILAVIACRPWCACS